MLFVQCLEQREERLLISGLDRPRDVLVLLLERLVRASRRTERTDQPAAVKGADFRRAIFPSIGNVSDMVPEMFQDQPKSAIGPNAHDFAKWYEIVRFAIRRESHHFVLVTVMPEPEALRARGVRNAQRVRKLNAIDDLTLAPLPDSARGRG